MRLALAGFVWLGGFSHLALVIAVLAFMPLVGFAEVQVAKRLVSRPKSKRLA